MGHTRVWESEWVSAAKSVDMRRSGLDRSPSVPHVRSGMSLMPRREWSRLEWRRKGSGLWRYLYGGADHLWMSLIFTRQAGFRVSSQKCVHSFGSSVAKICMHI